MLSRQTKIFSSVTVLFCLLSILLTFCVVSEVFALPPECDGQWVKEECSECPGEGPCCCVSDCIYGETWIWCEYLCWC